MSTTINNKRRNDVLLVGLLILSGLLLCILLLRGRMQGAVAVVTVDGEIVGRYPLTEEEQRYEIAGTGGTNLLVIADGAAEIREADCPDKVCVRTGRIQYEGQTIVCLPHKVIVEIAGGEDADVDTVAK